MLRTIATSAIAYAVYRLGTRILAENSNDGASDAKAPSSAKSADRTKAKTARSTRKSNGQKARIVRDDTAEASVADGKAKRASAARGAS